MFQLLLPQFLFHQSLRLSDFLLREVFRSQADSELKTVPVELERTHRNERSFRIFFEDGREVLPVAEPARVSGHVVEHVCGADFIALRDNERNAVVKNFDVGVVCTRRLRFNKIDVVSGFADSVACQSVAELFRRSGEDSGKEFECPRIPVIGEHRFACQMPGADG